MPPQYLLPAGADGLFFDNLFSKCYCPICRKGFADYTEKFYGQRHDLPVPEAAQGPRDVGNRSGAEVIADSHRRRDASRTRSKIDVPTNRHGCRTIS